MKRERDEGIIIIDKPLSEVEKWLMTDDTWTEEAYKEKALHLCFEAGLDITQSSFALRLLLTPYTTVDYATLIENLKGYESIDTDRLHNLARSSNNLLEKLIREENPISHEEQVGYSYMGPDVLDLYPDPLKVRNTYFEDETFTFDPEQDIVLVDNQNPQPPKENKGTRAKNKIYTNVPDIQQEMATDEFNDLLQTYGMSEKDITLINHIRQGVNSSQELSNILYGNTVGATALSRRIVYIRKRLEKHAAPIVITSNQKRGYQYHGPQIKSSKQRG